MYDFLYQDTQPLTSLLADIAKLSLPQARLAIDGSLQAIVSALLAYQQQHQGQTVSKRLFTRNAIKELRQYNSMNFTTINATLYHRHDVADTIFGDSACVVAASKYIAAQISANASQVQILLSCLSVIVIRELAILADYSQLNNDELDQWFALQPQFLSATRFAVTESIIAAELQADIDNAIGSKITTDSLAALDSLNSLTNSDSLNMSIAVSKPPPFDPYWYKLTKFTPNNAIAAQDMQQATSNYLKVIGRSTANIQQGGHNDMLVFAAMPAIALPHQRWLLQLAKVADIYLQRNRLRITSEPATTPTAPLVSLGLIGAGIGNSGSNNDSNSERPSTINISEAIKSNKPLPLWKNPIILIIILVIGSLSALAYLKYQKQKSDGALPAIKAVLEHDQAERRKQQDLASAQADEENAVEVDK
jgi:hypothetical protein